MSGLKESLGLDPHKSPNVQPEAVKIVVTETYFIENIERLYSRFRSNRPGYVGKNYRDLIFTGEITYKGFIKIHNFKAQIPLPLPSCDCVFTDLANALSRPTTEEKLLALGKLEGFRLPMASAVLHFSNPSSYAIIDENVVKGMKQIGWAARKTVEINNGTIMFYTNYLHEIQRITSSRIKGVANKYDVTPMRLVEASLYALGKRWVQ